MLKDRSALRLVDRPHLGHQRLSASFAVTDQCNISFFLLLFVFFDHVIDDVLRVAFGRGLRHITIVGSGCIRARLQQIIAACMTRSDGLRVLVEGSLLHEDGSE